MIRFNQYQFYDGQTPLSQDTFNPIFQDLDSRIHALEGFQPSWEQTLESVIAYGLERVNEGVTPALNAAQEALDEALERLAETSEVATMTDLEQAAGRPSAASYTYDGEGRLSGLTETVAGLTRTMTIAYNPDGTVATVTTVYNGITRVETYAYSGGNLTGMTAVES